MLLSLEKWSTRPTKLCFHETEQGKTFLFVLFMFLHVYWMFLDLEPFIWANCIFLNNLWYCIRYAFIILIQYIYTNKVFLRSTTGARMVTLDNDTITFSKWFFMHTLLLALPFSLRCEKATTDILTGQQWQGQQYGKDDGMCIKNVL